MPTLNASKWGYVVSSNFSTHAAARGQSTGNSVVVGPSSGTAEAVRYRRFSAKGGSTFYAVQRAFYYFDTSGITGTVTAATLNVQGALSADSNTIIVPSTAFSGDGSTNLATSDLGNVAFNTTYAAGFTGWATSGNISMALRSTALSDIQNNNAFICAILQFDNDFSDSELTSNDDLGNGINYGTTAYLDYTVAGAGPSDVTSLSGIAKADITSVNSIAIADITSINTVS